MEEISEIFEDEGVFVGFFEVVKIGIGVGVGVVVFVFIGVGVCIFFCNCYVDKKLNDFVGVD